MNPRQLWTTPESDGCSAYCVRVTSPRLPLTALAAAAALALLTGCSPEPAVPTAPPAATAEPLFATDEEALAAAEAAFAEYLEVSFQVFADGGLQPEQLEEVATGEVLRDDLARADRFEQQGLRQEGAPKIISTKLQSHSPGPPDEVEVVTYVCLDATSTNVVDSNGNFAGNPDQEATVTVENIFTALVGGKLLLEQSEIWEDGPTC